MKFLVSFFLLCGSLVQAAEKSERKSTPRKYPLNSAFAPGGTQEKYSELMPVISASTIGGFGFGAIGFRSMGMYGGSFSYVYASETKSYFGVKLRRSLYMSPEKNFSWDIYAAGRTVKKITYTRVGESGKVKNIEVVDEALAPGVGTGATYSFLQSLAVSAEAFTYYHPIDDEVEFEGSTYLSYLMGQSGISLLGGWIANRPVVGIGIMYVRLTYDIEDELLIGSIEGLSF